jgi:hypothetical protein
MQNGRINLSYRTPAGSVPGHPSGGTGDFNRAFTYRQETVASESEDAIRGNVMATPMNQAYFSPANVQIVQNKIRKAVFDRSRGEFVIDNQSVDELMIVMRAMYLQYSKNLPNQIPEQIAELNDMVVDWCAPKILAECSMHKTYLHDIQNLPVPLQQPMMMSMKGTKSATLDRFF